MERKRGGDGERQQTSRSTTITTQQQDGKDKRKTGWRETGGGVIKWREKDKLRWRGGSREGEILGGGGVVGRKVGKKEAMGKERKSAVVNTTCEKKQVILSCLGII